MSELIVLLAAGTGSRLRPLTNSCPKCMVEINGVNALELLTSRLNFIENKKFLIVGGHCVEKLARHGAEIILNEHYRSTNMVYSLYLCYNKILESDSEFVNIFYSDIFLSQKNVKTLFSAAYDFSLLVDRDWERLWAFRMDDYLSDVESLSIRDGLIIDIGKKVTSTENIDGQFVGALRLRRSKLLSLLKNYQISLGTQQKFEVENMYMTDFIMQYIESGGEVRPIFINGGWVELDSISDFQAYTSPAGKIYLSSILNLEVI